MQMLPAQRAVSLSAQNRPDFFDAPGEPTAVRVTSVLVRPSVDVSREEGTSLAEDRVRALVEELEAARDGLRHDGRDYVVLRAPEQPGRGVRVWLAYADEFVNAKELAALAPGDLVKVNGAEAELIAFVDTHERAADNTAAFVAKNPGLSDLTLRAQERARHLDLAPTKPSPFINALREPKRDVKPLIKPLPKGGAQLPTQRVDEDHLRFFLFGDSGKGSQTQHTVSDALHAAVQEDAPHFGLHSGDVIYPSGVTSATDPVLQTRFADHYDRLGVPIYTSLGNHDHKTSGSPGAFVEFANSDPNDAMVMPTRFFNVRYDFDGGSAEFIVIDSHVVWRDFAQLRWLKNVLRESTADWKIVIGHHPAYSGGQHGPDLKTRLTALPKLRKYGADAYLSGHEHDQQILLGRGGVLQLVSGSAGGTRPTALTDRSLFATSAPGFMKLKLSADALEIDVVDAEKGETLMSLCTKRGGGLCADVSE